MSLRQWFERNGDRRYIMFGGKGGLGKTTFSAATAYWLARQGHRVLVFSVDPQASLSDIFERDIFGKGAVKIVDNLWAQEIDADSNIKAYQQEVRKKIVDMYGFEHIPEEIEQYTQGKFRGGRRRNQGLRRSLIRESTHRVGQLGPVALP